MDEDSVDSEPECRLVISTNDSLPKGSIEAQQPFLKGAISDFEYNSPQIDSFISCSSPLISDENQGSNVITSGDRQNNIYSCLEAKSSVTTSDRSDSTEKIATKPVLAELLDSPTDEEALLEQEVSSGYQPEEGELEEGELDDDEEMADVPQVEEQIIPPAPVEAPKKQPPKLMELEGIKKRPRERDDDRRRKRRRHHKDDDHTSKSRKKHFLKEEREPDFDSLLKQELYLRGEGSTPEVFQNDEEVVSGESGSSEEWEKPGRKRPRMKGSRSKSKSPSRKNEAICMFFLQGNCQKGNSCPYSHEMAPTRKLELCKFYMVDRCAKREKCLYMHKDFPCKYYHFGMKCVAGDDCKFSHSSLQEPAKNILCKHIESAPKDILGDFPRIGKNIAMSVITLTLDKRKGLPITDEALESVIEVEGKGFKYVDRGLREYRKRNGIEKSTEKERTNKDLEEKSLKKTRTKHKGESKEQDRRSSKDRSKPREKNRDGKDRHRSRDRERDRRDRSDRNHNSDDANRSQKSPYPLGGTQRQRDFFQRIDNINRPQQEDDMSVQVAEPRNTAPFDQQTKWYSSDEENEQVNDRPGLFSPKDRRKKVESNFSAEQPHFDNCQTADLKNIDFNYIQQLLNKVQAPKSVQSENYNHSSVDQRENHIIRKPENFSKELKEVFESSPKRNRPMNLTVELQNLIKTAREKSTISDEQYSRDDYGGQLSRDPRHIYEDSRELSLDPRQDSRNASSSGDQVMDTDILQPTRDPRFDRQVVGNMTTEHQGSVLDDRERQEETYSSIFEDKSTNDIDLRSIANLPILRQINQKNDASSIYDIDLGQLDDISAAEIDDINSVMSRMPTHTPAKEINGSINANPLTYYQLIEVTVEKPDFSNLKHIQDDRRYFEDPRLRLMFRRNSNEEESPASPITTNRSDSNEYQLSVESIISDRVESKETRDPRKQPPRDPRAEGKLMKCSKVELRVDPRVAQRGDPRGSHSREPMMEPHGMEEQCDRSMNNPMFLNGHPLDNAMPNFNNLGPIPNSYPKLDPRGRPGLLGPAPGHGHRLCMQGPMHRPPYLLATPQMAPLSFGRDRDDMMLGPPSGLPQDQLWEGGSSYKDPRASRDRDNITRR